MKATTPEQELLLLCGRTRLEEEGASRLRRLFEEVPVDWDAVLIAGARHAITPLLHHHMAAEGQGRVPESVLQELRRRYLAIAARNLVLGRELVALLDALEDAGAPAVAWKGPVLAAYVYPGPDLRSFHDLDIIVRRQDVAGVLEVLQERGYSAVPGRDLPDQERLRSAEQDLTMENPETGILVDVHWGRVQRYHSAAMDCEVLWGESEPMDLHGSTIRALAPDTLLLALALHGAKHGPFPWPALKWVTDMEAFLRARGTDTRGEAWWRAILERARSLGCHRRLLLGLLLAGELLEAPIPPSVEADLRDETGLRALVPPIRDRLLASEPIDFSLGERLRFDLAVRERLRDRVRYRARRILIPGKRDLRTLPAPLRFLQAPLRLLRLSGRYLLKPSRVRTLLSGDNR